MKWLILFVALPVYGQWQPPTVKETIFMGVATGFVAADIATTILVLKKDMTVENNPLLGEHPSPARIIVSGTAAMIPITAYWYALSPKARWLVPTVVIGVESLILTGNAKILFHF